MGRAKAEGLGWVTAGWERTLMEEAGSRVVGWEMDSVRVAVAGLATQVGLERALEAGLAGKVG